MIKVFGFIASCLYILCLTNFSYGRVIDFNTYVSPTDNDFKNYFYEPNKQDYYVQSTSGGITGGALIPSQAGSAQSNVAILKQNQANFPGRPFRVAMSFHYDESLFNYVISYPLVLYAFTYTSQYSVVTITSYLGWLDENSLIIRLWCGDESNDGIIINKLIDKHWYKLELEFTYVGGQFYRVDVKSSLYDLGLSGLNKLSLIGSTSMSGSNIAFSGNSVQCALFSEQCSGTAALDNFEVKAPNITPIISFLLLD